MYRLPINSYTLQHMDPCLFLPKTLLHVPCRRDCPVIVLPLASNVIDCEVPKAGEVVVTQRKRPLLALQEAAHCAHAVDPAIASTTTDGIQRQDTVVQPHANELVGRIAGIVAVLRGIVLCPVVLHRRRIGTGAADDFSNKAAGEWCHV